MKKIARAFDVVRTGEQVWRAIAPGRRIKTWRNKRRARKGKPLLEYNEGDFDMLPQGTMTNTGAVGAMVTPVVTSVLVGLGVGECTPETIEAGCVGATQIAGAAVTMLFAIVALIGYQRKKRRAAAELEAAKGQ